MFPLTFNQLGTNFLNTPLYFYVYPDQRQLVFHSYNVKRPSTGQN